MTKWDFVEFVGNIIVLAAVCNHNYLLHIHILTFDQFNI